MNDCETATILWISFRFHSISSSSYYDKIKGEEEDEKHYMIELISCCVSISSICGCKGIPFLIRSIWSRAENKLISVSLYHRWLRITNQGCIFCRMCIYFCFFNHCVYFQFYPICWNYLWTHSRRTNAFVLFQRSFTRSVQWVDRMGRESCSMDL